MPGGLESCTFSKVSKFLKISFALLGASYNVVQLILHWVTPQRIVFWKKAAHKVDLLAGNRVLLMSYASRAWGHSLSKKINSRLIRRTQRRFLLRVIKGYKTISYEAVFAISGIPPIDLVILNNLDVRENYLSTSLGTLDGTIPVSLLPHPLCRKPITLVSYTNEIFQEYKTVCFTDGSKLNGRVGLACVIYEKGVEYVTFQHRLRDECSVFQAELLRINLVVQLIQDSLRQGGTLNFLICTDSLSSLHCLLNVNSTAVVLKL
ncbi:RNase H domain-containing protein [Trichonephila clavipes]|uniref:RNase H domain-containing protein n=1 Tax=Trichonephila clavipes TaxID=2585209 RepID=A0A8X6VMQ7_TRICX|nr:RNase H domain-containing protein [Trichonephila clavipes]